MATYFLHQGETPGRTRGTKPHLNVAALRAIVEFLTQVGVACKSTIVLTGGQEGGGGRLDEVPGSLSGIRHVCLTVR